MDGVIELQDLGELKTTLRTAEGTGPTGVETLRVNDGKSFSEASEAFRAVLDEYYGENFDRITGPDESVVIERLVVQSDDLPYIEYRIVEELDDE